MNIRMHGRYVFLAFSMGVAVMGTGISHASASLNDARPPGEEEVPQQVLSNNQQAMAMAYMKSMEQITHNVLEKTVAKVKSPDDATFFKSFFKSLWEGVCWIRHPWVYVPLLLYCGWVGPLKAEPLDEILSIYQPVIKLGREYASLGREYALFMCQTIIQLGRDYASLGREHALFMCQTIIQLGKEYASLGREHASSMYQTIIQLGRGGAQ